MSDVRVNIVGVGNTLMGDDGVGPAAIEAMAARSDLPAGVRLHEAGLALTDVLGQLDPDAPLFVVDAVRGGQEPGTVYRVELSDLSGADGAPGGPISLHEISVLPALRIEALTGRTFRDVTVFGIEPGSVAWDHGLSTPVAAKLDKLITAVLHHAETNQPVALTAGEPAR